jgi:hypothetical protein
VNQEQRTSVEESANLLITAHAEFLEDALRELKRVEKELRSIETLAPDIALCSVPDPARFMRMAAETRPVFARHLAPVQATVRLANTEADLEKLAASNAPIAVARSINCWPGPSWKRQARLRISRGRR